LRAKLTARVSELSLVAVPDRFEQLLLGDGALVLAQQEQQQIEHLGLHRHGPPGPRQLEAARVQHAVGEAKTHRGRAPDGGSYEKVRAPVRTSGPAPS
jgi:hypothetical protein